MTHNKFHVDDKKLLIRKICQLHFASSVNSLILSHNCQEKFLSQWGLLNNWWNGVRRLSTVEKEEASTFQAADLANTVSHLELIVSCLLIGQFEFDFICITIGTNKRQLKTHSNQMTQGADRVVPGVPRVPRGTNT